MKPFRNILLLLATALAASCSIHGKLEEEKVVDDRMPMVFGTSSAVQETVVSKAALTSDFRVSVWKSFGSSSQQNVMDGYQVEYDGSGIPYKWDYTGVEGQIQRYWDLSAYPYEFRAVAPYHATGVSLTPDGVTINVPFRAQSLINDAYNYANEQDVQPGVVAHVNRVKSGSEYIDTDIIKNLEINTAAEANATREVHLPFHHLNSKIGFRVFIDNPMPLWNDYSISIQSIEIKAVKTGFITESDTYSATNAQGLATGTFSNNTTVNEFTLLKHGLYMDGTETHWNFHYHLSQATAFDLTEDYLQQIPQSGVKLYVTVHLHTHHVEAEDEEFTFDRYLSLDKTNLDGDQFTWEPDKRYIYYLHIPNLHGHEIVIYTCEVLPWDEVQTTDIPVEL